MKFRLITSAVYLACLAQFISLPTLSASESPLASMGDGQRPKMSSEAFWSNSPAERSADSSAVDANGVRYRGLDYGRKRLPWLQDVIKPVAPDYPDRDRILRHEGNGLFQLTLDLKTGLVTKVTVIQSTGFPALDTSADAALRQWRLKPGKWKEIKVGVRFTTTLSRSVEPTRLGVILIGLRCRAWSAPRLAPSETKDDC